jgi:hypothetical protein
MVGKCHVGVHMRLVDFLLKNAENILIEWEDFARSLFPAAANLDSEALRDHAHQMLQAIAEDLSTDQTQQAQFERSLGRAHRPTSAPATAAQTHALLPAQGGFNIIQLTAEFPALRASVLRMWMDQFRSDRPGARRIRSVLQFSERSIQELIPRNAWSRHAQPTAIHSDDRNALGCIECRRKSLERGVSADPQRRKDAGAS